MQTGETDATLLRIGPLKAVDSNGDAVIGEDFAAAGEAELSINDAAWADADVPGTRTVEEIGDGYYYLQGIAADAAARGFVSFKLDGACIETIFREDVEDEPQGIPVGTVDADDLHVGPIVLEDEDGIELVDTTGVVVETSINGSAWAAAAGSLVMIDDGEADYVPHATDVANAGWICVKVTGACREYAIRSTIVAPADAVAPVESVVSPAEGTVPGDYDAASVTPLIVDIEETNLAYAAVFAVLEAQPDQRLCVYRRGAFVSPFDGYSVASAPSAGVLRLSVRHNSGWPPGDVTLEFDPVDTSGNLSDP